MSAHAPSAQDDAHDRAGNETEHCAGNDISRVVAEPAHAVEPHRGRGTGEERGRRRKCNTRCRREPERAGGVRRRER